MHQRDREELKNAKQEIKRLYNLVSVGNALDYLKKIIEISDTSDWKSQSTIEVLRAESQLRDEVINFLNTFKE